MLYKVAQYSSDCFRTFERELSPKSIRIYHTMGYFALIWMHHFVLFNLMVSASLNKSSQN